MKACLKWKTWHRSMIKNFSNWASNIEKRRIYFQNLTKKKFYWTLFNKKKILIYFKQTKWTAFINYYVSTTEKKSIEPRIDGVSYQIKYYNINDNKISSFKHFNLETSKFNF